PNPKPPTQNPTPHTPPKPQTPNPKPQTPTPKLQTPNPKPQTLNPKPQTPKPKPKTRSKVRVTSLAGSPAGAEILVEIPSGLHSHPTQRASKAFSGSASPSFGYLIRTYPPFVPTECLP
ncbi:hypothetical protein T484DRAFT_1646879, partial [Baffinella frigidus]